MSHVCTEAYLACAVVKLLAGYVLPWAVFVVVVVCCFAVTSRGLPNQIKSAPPWRVMKPCLFKSLGLGFGFRI